METFYRIGQEPSIDPGGPMSVSVERIDLPYMSKASETWQYKDKAGHTHRYADAPSDHWPTLEWVDGETHYCEDCRDDHDFGGHFECPQCHERIHPGMTGPGIESVPGRTTYTIGGYPVSPEQFKAVAELRGDNVADML